MMKDPPKTLPLFSYGDVTKKAINFIDQILHRSTSQPRLQILPLPPMLPQNQSENIQLQNNPRIPVLALRVEPVSQPPRVQTHQSSPIPTLREKPFTPPRLDPHPNTWIKKSTKYLNTPQIPKSRKTQATPRQVQHRLHRSPRNLRQNFRTQASQHLVANHLLNLPNAFHI